MVACRAARPRRCADGTEVPAAAVLDATGHALKLVEFDQKFDPGYQATPPPPPPRARAWSPVGARGAVCGALLQQQGRRGGMRRDIRLRRWSGRLQCVSRGGSGGGAPS